MKGTHSARWMFLALFLCLAPFCSKAQVSVGIGIHVGIAPPVLPVYEQPICPEPNLIWTPGYWAYGDDGYFWVPGAWVSAPYVGALWTPGYWGWSDGQYVFNDGYWGSKTVRRPRRGSKSPKNPTTFSPSAPHNPLRPTDRPPNSSKPT